MENNKELDDGMKETAIRFLKNAEKFVTRNEDLTYTVQMPQGIKDYIVKDLTHREELNAKRLATADISEEHMCIVRSIVFPKDITTDKWLDLPAKVIKRLEYTKRYLDGDLDFLV